jgi:hypothetical protein
VRVSIPDVAMGKTLGKTGHAGKRRSAVLPDPIGLK